MTSALAPIASSEKVGQIRAVCFDIDDTLVDYVTSSRRGLAALVGHDDAWPLWERVTEMQLARYLTGEVDYETMRRERTRAFFAELGVELADSELAGREELRVQAMRAAWEVYEDVWPCLDWLRAAGLRIAAITNASGPLQRMKIADLGLSEVFDHVIIAGELGVAKPDPAIFHTATVALGLPPEQVMHVGDRLDLDAVGARDAGLHGVWLDRGDSHAEVPPGVLAITSLDELPEALVCDVAPVAT
ncbi:HAD family hydrolase [Allokutzneria albata]|uniref:HAD family hydrolase n=1 Tax=Allokutzneria albata TaxID=211114 RepID=UPI001E346F75|nr:HAD family hydrolase [Allokutzneria albata]